MAIDLLAKQPISMMAKNESQTDFVMEHFDWMEKNRSQFSLLELTMQDAAFHSFIKRECHTNKMDFISCDAVFFCVYEFFFSFSLSLCISILLKWITPKTKNCLNNILVVAGNWFQLSCNFRAFLVSNFTNFPIYLCDWHRIRWTNGYMIAMEYLQFDIVNDENIPFKYRNGRTFFFFFWKLQLEIPLKLSFFLPWKLFYSPNLCV